MHNGCILCGKVGSGKSRTALAYYIRDCGGELDGNTMTKPHKLYIITTARKRDTFEWSEECAPFHLSDVTIDSWNNIKKYTEVKSAFFIFDEQRVVGYGAWSKSFIKIAKSNHWILLSATPGDTWLDYIPVFIANGFYRNKAEFTKEHCVYSTWSKFPKVEGYLNTRKLIAERDAIMVNMEFDREVRYSYVNMPVAYDRSVYLQANRTRWNPYEEAPMTNAAELCYVLRRVVNSDSSRLDKLLSILMDHPRAIVFYNFDYELDILKNWAKTTNIKCTEYNGHKHEPLPEGDQWMYIVQYTAGAEGWNCTNTDTIIFFSLNYSYKIMTQAAGRIDRLNSPYQILYYFRLVSSAPIDLAIKRALENKRNFNESAFIGQNDYKKHKGDIR